MSRVQAFNADTTYSTSDVAVGGGGGLTFYIGGVRRGMKPTTGRSVKSLKFFYTENKHMCGLEISLTDGIATFVGRYSDNNTGHFVFEEGEKISSLKVWTDGHDNGRCGRIELVTDRNRQFNVDCPTDGDPHVYDIGSGRLAGVFGKMGVDMDCLGFSLLRHETN